MRSCKLLRSRSWSCLSTNLPPLELCSLQFIGIVYGIASRYINRYSSIPGSYTAVLEGCTEGPGVYFKRLRCTRNETFEQRTLEIQQIPLSNSQFLLKFQRPNLYHDQCLFFVVLTEWLTILGFQCPQISPLQECTSLSARHTHIWEKKRTWRFTTLD